MVSRLKFQSLIGASLGLVLVVSLVTPASAEDAFNPDVTPTPDGGATFLVGEDGANIHFSTLTAGNRDGAQWTCDSVNDPECTRSKADYINGNSILKVCTSSADRNCIVRLCLLYTSDAADE